MVQPSLPWDEMTALAVAAKATAYAPYSHYAVGACVLDDLGQFHIGCNLECASFGLTICAERNALATMRVAGGRWARAVLVVTQDSGTPCGACRQVLAEFAEPGTELWVGCAKAGGERTVYPLSELLPSGFRLSP